MKIIRWSFVLPTMGIVLLTGLGVFLFRDALLRQALITAGQAAFGARVEIDTLKTDLGKARLSLSGVRVADRDDVWKNLFSIESVEAGFTPAALMAQKLVVDEAQLRNMQFGTSRKTSGALPQTQAQQARKKEQSSLFAGFKQRLEQEGEKMPAVNALGQLQHFDPDALLKQVNLKTPGVIASIRQELNGKYHTYQTQLQQLDPEQLLKDVNAAAEEIKTIKVQSPQDLAAAQEKFSQLKEKKQQLEQSLGQLKAMQQDITATFGDLPQKQQQVDAAIREDSQNAAAQAQGFTLDQQHIARMLFGQEWADRLELALNTVAFVRAHLPAPKEQQKITPAEHGVDVAFYAAPPQPGEKSAVHSPQVLVRKMLISGVLPAAAGSSAPVQFEGQILNLSSDPRQTGEPITAQATAKLAEQSYALQAEFDHRTDASVDSLSVKTQNLPLAQFGLEKNGSLPALTSGVADIDASLTLRADTLDSSVVLQIKDAAFAAGGNQLISDALTSVSQFSVTARAQGSPDNLSIDISSDLDQILAKNIGGIVAQQQEQVQAKLQEQLQAQFAQQKEELFAQLTGNNGELQRLLEEKLGALSAGNAQAENALNSESSVLSLPQVNQVKDALKGLFK